MSESGGVFWWWCLDPESWGRSPRAAGHPRPCVRACCGAGDLTPHAPGVARCRGPHGQASGLGAQGERGTVKESHRQEVLPSQDAGGRGLGAPRQRPRAVSEGEAWTWRMSSPHPPAPNLTGAPAPTHPFAALESPICGLSPGGLDPGPGSCLGRPWPQPKAPAPPPTGRPAGPLPEQTQEHCTLLAEAPRPCTPGTVWPGPQGGTGRQRVAA